MVLKILVNWLAPGKFDSTFSLAIPKLISVMDGWGISHEIALRWKPLDLNIFKSTLVQIMAWCCQPVPFLAATKQLYEWFSPSVRLSVRLSVCPSVRLSVTPFWLCSHHPIIMKFSGVITSDKSDVHAKGQGQRSKVKVTEVTTQIFVSGL